MNKTGKLIQELRAKAGFTQRTLAEALHITDKAISKWERGICLPDVSLLPKISLLLDVDLDVLISKYIEQDDWVVFSIFRISISPRSSMINRWLTFC